MNFFINGTILALVIKVLLEIFKDRKYLNPGLSFSSALFTKRRKLLIPRFHASDLEFLPGILVYIFKASTLGSALLVFVGVSGQADNLLKLAVDGFIFSLGMALSLVTLKLMATHTTLYQLRVKYDLLSKAQRAENIRGFFKGNAL